MRKKLVVAMLGAVLLTIGVVGQSAQANDLGAVNSLQVNSLINSL